MFHVELPGRTHFHSAALTLVLLLAPVSALHKPLMMTVPQRDLMRLSPVPRMSSLSPRPVCPHLRKSLGSHSSCIQSAVMAASTSTSSKTRANGFLCWM